jgi:hypothetical protein
VDQAIGSATLAKAIAAGNYKTLQKEGNGVAANGAGLGHYADFSPSGRLVISRSSSASTVSAVYMSVPSISFTSACELTTVGETQGKSRVGSVNTGVSPRYAVQAPLVFHGRVGVQLQFPPRRPHLERG